MELVDLPDFGVHDYADIEDGEKDPFGTDRLGIFWLEKENHLGLTEAGRLIGHAGWVPSRARAATGELIEVVGLGGVLMHRTHRGSGVGRQLVSGAMTRMRDLDRPLGMLFCRTERVRFYEGLGWHRVHGQVTVDQPSGPMVMPLVTCWTALTSGAAPPETDLHVEGLPF